MTTPTSIVVTAAAMRTALGSSRAEVLRRMQTRELALAPSLALEGSTAADRTYAVSGGSPGPDRAEELLAAGLADALREAGLDAPASRGDRRVLIVVGTTLNGMRHLRAFLRGGSARSAAYLTPGSVVSIAAARCGLHAAGITISTACASGITTIGIACDLLRQREVDLVLAGGYDPVSEFSHAGFGSLRLLASDRPRPFAHDRDGMRTGEGAAVLVLEREADAHARGARVLARVAAIAETSDAYHLTQPHPDGSGAAAAMREAIERGGAPDLVVAHATGTEANDLSEYRAYEGAFGDRLASVPVTAPKSALGHTLGAAGTIDAALCIAMAESRSLLPTLTEVRDIDLERFPALALVVEPTARTLSRTMNVAIGFGGSNAALVLEHAPTSRDHGRHGAMAAAPEPIWITGVAAVLPNGAFAGSALGACGELRAGDVDDAILAPHLDLRAARRIAPISRLVRAVVRLALDDARLPPELVAGAHALCATQHGAVGYSVDAYRDVIEHGLDGGNPLLFAESVPNVPGAQCSLAFGVRGPAISVIGSRVGFMEAAWLARARMLERSIDRVIVVAAEERHDRLDQVLAAWKQGHCGDPLTAAGAVAMIFEREGAARGRGATPRARLGSINWRPPSQPRSRELTRSAAELAALHDGRIDAPARPGLLGRMERRAIGDRLGATLGAELHAAGPALLAARRVACGEAGAVLAIDSFGASALMAFEPVPNEAKGASSA